MKEPTKILIISYFYPPCPLTAAQRVGSFVRYLPNFGFYPVIVTRNWDIADQTPAGMLADCGQTEIHEQNGDHEVYYLPYRSSLRDRMFAKSGKSFLYRWISKGLTLFNQLGQNLSNQWIPYTNLYQTARSLMREDRELRILLISGNPFESFRFGYLLQKEFGDVKWFADYRDAWTSSTIHPHLSTFPWKQINSLQSIYERKWVGTAEGLTSVSAPLVDQLSRFTGVPGHKVENGFEEAEFTAYRGLQKYEDFTITYVGTLYPAQEIELFFEAFKSFIAHKPQAKVRVRFPGLGYDQAQVNRIQSLAGNLWDKIEITGRIPKEQVLVIQGRSHLLLYVGWKGHEGIVASKVYEYLASGTKVLLVPSDKGDVERMIGGAQGGYIVNKVEDCKELLEKLYEAYLKDNVQVFQNEGTKLEFFSRKRQAMELASFIKEIVE